MILFNLKASVQILWNFVQTGSEKPAPTKNTKGKEWDREWDAGKTRWCFFAEDYGLLKVELFISAISPVT